MRWLFLFLASFALATPSFLLPKEIAWLQSHPAPFRVAITQIPNQVIKTNKGFKGFSIDLFKLLEKKIEHPITFIYYPTWKEALQAAKNKEVDILFLAQKTPSRLAYFDFTDTVLTQHNHLIVNIQKPFTSLSNVRRIALVQGSALQEYIRSRYPKITIFPTKNELESLQCVSDKKCNATISEPVRASYYIQHANLDNLTITNNIGYNYYLAIATIKKLPQLNVILSKALSSLDPKELEALKLKWGYIQEKLDYRKLILFAAIATLLGLLTLYFFTLNQKLKRALQQIEQLQKEKNSIMQTTISTIAHHWRQPLNTLAMLIDLVQLRYHQNKLDAPFIDYFHNKAKSYIKRLSDSLELFRSFKLTESKESCDLVTIAQTTLQEFQNRYPSVHLTLTAPATLPMYSYPHNIKKLITILIQNSIDASQHQKEANIELVIEENKETISLQITDTGKGIVQENVQNIFDPYFSTKSEKNDVGLGLYIAKLIVTHYLKGEIRFVKNNPTTFEVTFYKESR